eukprot:scpid96059/ scgid17019/ 
MQPIDTSVISVFEEFLAVRVAFLARRGDVTYHRNMKNSIQDLPHHSSAGSFSVIYPPWPCKPCMQISLAQLRHPLASSQDVTTNITTAFRTLWHCYHFSTTTGCVSWKPERWRGDY